MKAFQFVDWQQPGQLRDVPVPEPGPGEVLIKVGGAGACHSDLRLLEAPAGSMPLTLPFTPGHENAGWVETMGPGVTGFSPGDPVIVYGPWGCGLCMNCRQGMENYCQTRCARRPRSSRWTRHQGAWRRTRPRFGRGRANAEHGRTGGASAGTPHHRRRWQRDVASQLLQPPHECAVSSPFWGTIPELIEVISLAQTGKIKMLVEHFPLDRAGVAYDLLHDGKIQGRAVITPHD